MTDCITDCAEPGDFAGGRKEMEELKPCPFCPTEKVHRIGWHKQYQHEIETEGILFRPFCRHCGCSLRATKTKAEAITAWNTRPSPWILITPETEFGDDPEYMWCSNKKDKEILLFGDLELHFEGGYDFTHYRPITLPEEK